jgi:excinuclease UvrABC nuclease subunit
MNRTIMPSPGIVKTGESEKHQLAGDYRRVGPKRRQMLLKYMGGLQGYSKPASKKLQKYRVSHGLAEKIFYSLKH